VPVAWVAPENFHVTLKFLGGVDEAKIPALIAALHSAMARQRGFGVQVGGLGAFPSPMRPRVLWAGVAVGAQPLGALAQSVDEATAALGFPREARPFSPHISLGRVRDSRRAPALAEALEGAGTWPFGTVTIEHVALMRSDLSPRGARYTTLAAAPLAR
jgi:2'-5' RNA ligase